jgi:small subunit ribosomal protein S1
VLEIGQDVKVKVLDIDRDRQRISLGLKQTQSDPWQQVVEAYKEEDVVQGKVTKVVTFGAFVEIMPGVEGLVHISELAQHHVENPREIVSQGDVVNVKIIEVDADRRRLSLSLKRVEEADEVQPRADGEPLETPQPPRLDLSEDVFPEGGEAVEERTGDEATDEALAETPVAESEPEIPADEPEPEAPVAESEPEAPVAESEPEAPVAESEPDIPVAEPEVPSEVTDASIEADAVAPEEQGPGDSEGEPPAAPDEAEQKES